MRKKIAALSAAALLLGGCAGTTYGSGAPISLQPAGAVGRSRISPAVKDEAKAHGLLFVANLSSNEVEIFPQRQGGSLIGTITNGIDEPVGLGVDGSQNLYVANAGEYGDEGFVTEYAPPYSGAPITTYSQGLQNSAATNVAIGADGSVYVSEYSAGIVVEYPPNSTIPSAQLTFEDYPGVLGPGESGKPEGLALNASNDLFVAINVGSAAEVIKFKPGSQKGRVEASFGGSSGGVTFDNVDNLLAERQLMFQAHLHVKRHKIPPAIYVFPPGQKSPSRKIDPHLQDAFAMAFGGSGKRLYVSGSIITLGFPDVIGWGSGVVAPDALKAGGWVYCLSYPAGQLLYTISWPGNTWILGVAVTPPAPK
jgi:hypothetical protein